MEEIALTAAVYAKCGKLTSDESELEDTDIARESGWILNIFKEKFPSVRLRYIESVDESARDYEDRGEYDVNSLTRRVKQVFPWDAVEQAYTDPAMSGKVVGVTQGDEYYNWPSLWKINMQRKQEGLPRFRWHFDAIRRKLRIDPYPSSAGNKYWYFSVENTNWTIANMPAEFDDIFVIGTTWRIIDQIAMARSRLGGIQREGGFVTYPATELHNIAKDYKKEFYDELRLKTKIWNM